MDAFGSARDDWIETDFQGWLGANKFYEVRFFPPRYAYEVYLNELC